MLQVILLLENLINVEDLYTFKTECRIFPERREDHSIANYDN